MSELARIGVAIPADLLESFDKQIERRGYQNRSEAFRDLIRDSLIRETVATPNAQAVGTLTLIYDHHVRQLSDKLTEFQHDHHHQIMSTIHVHLDHHACLEVILLKGKAKDLQSIADKIISMHGIQHGRLTLTVAGKPVA
jgi:CopG family transcriptional regulator, nickel-responsive regulator